MPASHWPQRGLSAAGEGQRAGAGPLVEMLDLEMARLERVGRDVGLPAPAPDRVLQQEPAK